MPLTLPYVPFAASQTLSSAAHRKSYAQASIGAPALIGAAALLFVALTFGQKSAEAMLHSSTSKSDLYGPLTGCTAARYSSKNCCTTLVQPANSNSYLVMLGGLSDGLLPTPYTSLLASKCAENSWNFVNPILRSSYNQFGFGSLDEDVEDLDDLIEFLKGDTEGAERGDFKLILVGHSTGCQQIVHFLRKAALAKEVVNGVFLQAPVSDRESQPNSSFCSVAEEMVKSGKGDEFMPRSCMWSPITANRFASLYSARADGDDYFSSDLTDGELASRLGHVKKMVSDDEAKLSFCVAAFSMKDEYVPENVDKDAIVDRLAAIGGMEPLKLDGTHNLMPAVEAAVDSQKKLAHELFCDKVAEKLKVL